MYFKKLEMHGFKSFAEPVTIDFDDGVTCIVGPNGSGKSNISDALRWVLGEQSSKTLRGGKMEDVIFSGTASRKSRGMAEVTLVIDNTTGILDIDYNEVANTRRMFRSGESEYLINNNQCRLRDIRELIMDTGIGVDGYSIIGQGKIADIVSNKPESRREIFEEAAGIVMYKSKKTEAERKLNSTNTNLDRVNDIISEIEGRIDGLREDSIKAKEYLKLRDTYKELEINITLKNAESLELKLEEMKDDIMELSSNLATSKAKKEELDGQVSKDRTHVEDLQALRNKANDDLVTKINEINQLTNQDQLNTERVATIDRDVDRLQSEIDELRDKIAKEENNKREMESNVEEINKELEDVVDKLQAHIDYFNQINGETIQLLADIEGQKTELFNKNTDLISKQGEVKSMESYKENLAQRKEELMADRNNLKDDSGKISKDIEDLEAEKHQQDQALQGAVETQKSLANKQDQLLQDQREIKKSLDDLRINISQLSARKRTIEEMENNYEGYNYAVKYIMKSNLRGIEGVVADLMKVPAGFEVAIETALGGALQNIVCQDDNSAKMAVNSLKANKAGRLTFLPLGSIKTKTVDVPSSLAGAKGFKGMATSCVNFDGKYQGIFNYLLGRVAIVDTMENAIALSKGNYGGIRFVTLDGEIINMSGAITGGKYKNNTANLLERKGEVDKLAEKISAMQDDSKAKERLLAENQDKLAKLQNDIAKASQEQKEIEIKLITYKGRLESLKDQSLKHQASEDRFDREMKNMESDFARADEMILRLNGQIEEAQNSIVDITAKIEADTAEYDQLKVTSDEASEKITAARIEQTELLNRKEGVENILQRVVNTIDDYNFQVDAKLTTSDNLQKEKNHIMFGSDDAEKLATEKTKEKEHLEGYIKEVDEEINQITQSIKEKTEEIAVLNDNVSSFGDQKYALEIKEAKGETQLENYIKKLWDEFELSYLQAMDFKKKDFVMSTAVKESREIKSRIAELGEVNIGAIKEYDQVGERYEFLTAQREDVEKAKTELESIISGLEDEIKTKFKDNFDKVVINFEEIFKELFGGGHAELRLEDCNNPLEAGIEIVAQPPGKKLQNINLMSGGEKTMTAIALMFAVLKTKPTPFCILDEVEAALDDANIDRFATYLKQFREIQFALITHQKVTMEHADVLYGVTMPERGISKVLSLKLEDNFEI